jgi:hypothetical protein
MLLSRGMALPLACLIALLSLSSVSSSLHDSIFHGNEECTHHSDGNHPCGSHHKGEGEEHEEELPCPVLLFAEGYLFQDFVPDLSASESFVSESKFFVTSHLWVSRKHNPFGARDPPLGG